MNIRSCVIVAVLFILFMAVVGSADAQNIEIGSEPSNIFPPLPMNERELSLPGDPQRPVTLQVTLFMPSGPGRHPLAVLLHGGAANGNPRSLERYRATFSADYFLSRGYAVALPMMRGFAGSGGDTEKHGCDLAAASLANARDVNAVIDDLRDEPKLDTSRIVVAGQSLGGWNALGVGVLQHEGIKGIISFSGGIRASDCHEQDSSLISASAELGAQSTLPSVWFYGNNDSIFSRETWRAMYSRFTSAGGKAELVAYGDFMDDSHQLLSHLEGIPIWAPKLDDFLAGIGMPSKSVYPGYMSTPLPPASGFAAIDDAGKLPYANDKMRASYRDFLRRSFTRVFVVAPAGVSIASDGGFDPIAHALSLCRRYAVDCQLYAVDNDVVWTARNSNSSPLHYRTVPAGRMSVIDFSSGVNADCSSKGVPKLWVVQSPAHGTARVAKGEGNPKFPAAHPYAHCNSQKVPGIALLYTPTSGFRGSDFLSFEEINLDNVDAVFKVALTVQ